MAKLDKAGRPTQAQDWDEEVGKGGKMAFAEISDSAEIGPAQAGDGHHVDALLAGAGQLTRGVEAAVVAVEQGRHPHAGVVGREAALFRVGLQDGREVEGLAHRVPDEVRQVSWRDAPSVLAGRAKCPGGTNSCTKGGNSQP